MSPSNPVCARSFPVADQAAKVWGRLKKCERVEYQWLWAVVLVEKRVFEMFDWRCCSPGLPSDEWKIMGASEKERMVWAASTPFRSLARFISITIKSGCKPNARHTADSYVVAVPTTSNPSVSKVLRSAMESRHSSSTIKMVEFMDGHKVWLKIAIPFRTLQRYADEF